MYTERFYRKWVSGPGLVTFRVKAGESDLQVYACADLRALALDGLLEVRGRLCRHIALHPRFLRSLVPVDTGSEDPFIRSMEEAGKRWGTGPMAAVAGAVAQEVGTRLLEESPTVIVENGGDIWALSPEPLEFLVYPGKGSPMSAGIPFTVDASRGVAVCTSSGRVGPSFSMGNADAVTAIDHTGAGADAAATALANRIRREEDVTRVVDSVAAGRTLWGIIAVCGESMGIWGRLRLSWEERNDA